MSRFTGDYQGNCGACQEYVEMAVGLKIHGEPVAMHFGPGGPQRIELRNVELVTMLDDELDVKIEYACPLCGGWSPGRVTCRAAPSV